MNFFFVFQKSMKLFLITLTLAIFQITDGSVTCDKIGPCGCKLSNGGGKIDLSPLSKLGNAPL